MSGIRCPRCRWRPERVEPLVVQCDRSPGAVLSRLRHGLEYVRHEGPLPGVCPSVALDVVPAMRRVVPARGLVRTCRHTAVARRERSRPDRLEHRFVRADERERFHAPRRTAACLPVLAAPAGVD